LLIWFSNVLQMQKGEEISSNKSRFEKKFN